VINTANDRVEVFEDVEGLYRWRRVDMDNGRIVSVSGDGYVNAQYAEEAAAAYNQDLDVYGEGRLTEDEG
jgi:uncharacterized protein YegP (UPF0339 family)